MYTYDNVSGLHARPIVMLIAQTEDDNFFVGWGWFSAPSACVRLVLNASLSESVIADDRSVRSTPKRFDIETLSHRPIV